ncbi:glycine betaine/L-proline ABC transporter ATP-binding protein [Glaciimonas sp. Gout2]|uniref:quaternary amine ABC transporter ATP-binding protein n=2 Tax=Glaciimonas TaxID=1229970 RepID=UPI002AB4D9E4|nr:MULTISPECIES: glycine betaine/L-proline ABC transporter ATP-binding protein [unclassified Glaciimonas]MDY7547510.1 glycine betaine/L-proline ABC transporter ATP-binding protein [Glaciimonas sp. CA11.2]MEB0013478.1 glycine betaine/L-proline ABC transporter ATP-binding protein [Glaciimonas sp. Cout2]MEB0081557.1 glycine betaine/L-proline ABC transporter ATP-binding protein [Glaciimonas sp. Gout2]
MKSGKVVVDHLYKVFGNTPEIALSMLKKGYSKDKIFAETGQVVGVQDVSFEVQEGEIFVLMGLSGSGKSTLIRLINRLVDPSAGSVWVDGQDVAAMSKAELIDLRRRDMSMVFQSFALMPHRTVLSNAAFGLEVAGIPKKDRERQAMKVLEQVGLASFANKLPCELSGGMQQRVGLARALSVNPSLMIMDEAFSALDPLKRKEMQDVLLELQKEQRRTIIFVSHDLEEAFRIGSRIAIMEGGRLVQVGTAQEIIDNPAEEYVRAFFDGVDTSRYLTASDLMQSNTIPLIKSTDELKVNPHLYASSGSDFAFVVDDARKVKGIVPTRGFADASGVMQPLTLQKVEQIHYRTSLRVVMGKLIASPVPLPVVDENGCYCGAISQSMILQALSKPEGSHV